MAEGRSLGLGSRMAIGAIAGFVGTMAMTRAMRRFHRELPREERYSLTPREIVDATAAPSDEPAKDLTTAAHFLYGAASGALLGAARAPVSPLSGAAAGVGIWLASYMGWIPAAGILKPAARHPARRNLAMIAAHAMWGWSTARAMRELVEARETIFAAGEDRDASDPAPPPEQGISRRRA